ncbi:MAG: ribonuclease E/G [Eubacterium sp.]|uniref:ribonuclease E/G n=1 Tax=Eubacterium sp. TaxID=142586 RepID=UPI0039960DEA
MRRCTASDVNATVGLISNQTEIKNNTEKLMKKFAKEIARQLQIRNISGTIVFC